MIHVGILGFGLMGRTHARAYLESGCARIVALADANPTSFQCEPVKGNLEGLETQTFDASMAATYDSLDELLADERVQAVSICTPTPTHVALATQCLEAGRHVLLEKPMGLTSAEAARVAEVAAAHPELVCVPAMCMRFWPAWAWLHDAIIDGRYGKVRSAHFTRIGTMPGWTSFYGDETQSGGAILDLHVHDADFVRWCFGDPVEVMSKGYRGSSGGFDHVVTSYRYDDSELIVTAEGSWMMPSSFPFTMRYRVDFESATADFDLRRKPELSVYERDGDPHQPALKAGEGYLHEVRAFLSAIERGAPVVEVTPADAVNAVRLVEKERESIISGRPVAYSAVL